MNRDMYDRFSSKEPDNGEEFKYDPYVDTLPDPEDLIDNKGLYYFIGYYCHAMNEYHQIGLTVQRQMDKKLPVLPGITKTESDIEQWLDNAQDWLPEWAQNLYIKEAKNE